MPSDTDDRDRNAQGRFADGIDPETVLDVFDARQDRAEPITASDVVDELEIARRTAHNKLNRLVDRGELATKKIGARGRVWWRPIPRDTPAESGRERGESASVGPADHSVGSDANPVRTARAARESDALDDVVDAVAAAEGWVENDTPARLAARAAAARAVLDYAAEHGSVSQQDAVENVRPEYPVEGQNARTWYRKTIRPVLNEADEYEYDNSAREYQLVDDVASE